MSDQEIDSVTEEEVAPFNTEQDGFQNVEEESQETQQKVDEDQERNWRAMRQRQKELEWEIRKRDELLEKALSAPRHQQEQQIQEEPEIPEDEYANYGGVKKVTKKTIEPLEREIQELKSKIAQDESRKKFESLKASFSDFDDVVNIETLEILEKEQPELAADIANMKDPYKMGLYSYKLIKSEGILDRVAGTRRKKDIDKRLEKNSKTVQTPLAYDKRPMAQAFKATAADEKRLYEEMMHYASMAGGL